MLARFTRADCLLIVMFVRAHLFFICAQRRIFSYPTLSSIGMRPPCVVLTFVIDFLSIDFSHTLRWLATASRETCNIFSVAFIARLPPFRHCVCWTQNPGGLATMRAVCFLAARVVPALAAMTGASQRQVRSSSLRPPPLPRHLSSSSVGLEKPICSFITADACHPRVGLPPGGGAAYKILGSHVMIARRRPPMF